jgi:hypothetical protein
VYDAGMKRKLSRAKQYAEVETLSINDNFLIRLGPGGLWVYARAYARAAALLPAPERPYEPVRYYLACHSIELALKAYLSIHGATMLELSESGYGHDLNAILLAADAKHLQAQVALTDEHRDEIVKASTYYAGKVFEYPAMGEALNAYPGLPNLDVLIAAAQVLVQALDLPCKQA